MLLVLVLALLPGGFAVDTSSEVNKHIETSTTANILNNTEFSVTCKSCSIVGDFSLSGGCNDEVPNCLEQTQPDSNFSSLPFDFTENWVGAVVEDFKVHIELEIALTPTGPTNEITIPLIGANGLDFPERIGAIFSLDWIFNPVIHGWVNSSTPATFTYGFDFEIPRNSAVFIPVFHLDQIKTVGFNQSSITPLNYTSKDPNDNFAFELSFRPIFEVKGSVAIPDAPSLFAEVFADVPKLDINVEQVTNATRDCKPAPPGTASDQIFHNLTHVVPTLSFDIGFNATLVGDHELQLGDNVTLPTSCLEYLPAASALGTVPARSNAAAGWHARVYEPLGLSVIVVALLHMF